MAKNPPLRPGIVLGAYPERDAPASGRFEQVYDQSMGALRRLVRRSPARYGGIVRRIGSEEEALRAAADAGLNDAVRDVRCRLRAEGLSNAACIRE